MPLYNNPYALSKSTVRRRRRAAFVATPDHRCPNCDKAHPNARTPHVFVMLPTRRDEPLRLGCRACLLAEQTALKMQMTQEEFDAEYLNEPLGATAQASPQTSTRRIEAAMTKLAALKRLCDENERDDSSYTISVYETPGEKQRYTFEIKERETGAVVEVSSGHVTYTAAVEDALSNVERLSNARTA